MVLAAAASVVSRVDVANVRGRNTGRVDFTGNVENTGKARGVDAAGEAREANGAVSGRKILKNMAGVRDGPEVVAVAVTGYETANANMRICKSINGPSSALFSLAGVDVGLA